MKQAACFIAGEKQIVFCFACVDGNRGEGQELQSFPSISIPIQKHKSCTKVYKSWFI